MEQNGDKCISIGEEMVEVENVFEEMYDDGFSGGGRYGNDRGDMEEGNGIISKSKEKRGQIGNSLLQLGSSDEVMGIRVGGKGVRLIRKDGKVGEGRGGCVLGVKVGSGGWVSRVDEGYYVVR